MNMALDLYMIMAVAMQNRQRSALLMSNAQFLFVARSYINIKRLRERWRVVLWLMYDCQWTD